MEPYASFVITLAARRRFSSTRSAEQVVQGRALNAAGSDMGQDGHIRENGTREFSPEEGSDEHAGKKQDR